MLESSRLVVGRRAGKPTPVTEWGAAPDAPLAAASIRGAEEGATAEGADAEDDGGVGEEEDGVEEEEEAEAEDVEREEEDAGAVDESECLDATASAPPWKAACAEESLPEEI